MKFILLSPLWIWKYWSACPSCHMNVPYSRLMRRTWGCRNWSTSNGDIFVYPPKFSLTYSIWYWANFVTIARTRNKVLWVWNHFVCCLTNQRGGDSCFHLSKNNNNRTKHKVQRRLDVKGRVAITWEHFFFCVTFKRTRTTAIPWSPCSWGAAPSCSPRRRRGWLCGCWRWPWCRPGLWRTLIRRWGCPSSSAGRAAAGGASLYSPPRSCSGPVGGKAKPVSRTSFQDREEMLAWSILCIHAGSCWSSGRLCFSPWISAQLISGFPHCWKFRKYYFRLTTKTKPWPEISVHMWM